MWALLIITNFVGKERVESCDRHKRPTYLVREALEGDGGSAEDPGTHWQTAFLCLIELTYAYALSGQREQEGQRFDKVAQEYSEDKAKGSFKSRSQIECF